MSCKLHPATVLHWGVRRECELDCFAFFRCKMLRDGMGFKGKGGFFFKLTFLKTFLMNVNLYYLTDLV